MIVWSDVHLCGLLAAYQAYYNATRTHLGIGKDSPEHRPIQTLGAIVAVPYSVLPETRWSLISVGGRLSAASEMPAKWWRELSEVRE